MKGEGWHSHCLSCFMQDSLCQDISGNAYWIGLGKSHRRGKPTLWILIGLGQIFCEVKFKIIVDLSTKIKKIPRKFFSGKFFSLSKFFSQLFCCFPPQLWFPQQPIDYQPRYLFLKMMPVLLAMEKAEMFRAIWLNFDQDKIKILPEAWW